MSGTEAFFHAMAPTLIANVLTVVFVYCFALIGQQARSGDEEGRLTYLWIIVMVFMFMLYGLYTWSVYPLERSHTYLEIFLKGENWWRSRAASPASSELPHGPSIQRA